MQARTKWIQGRRWGRSVCALAVGAGVFAGGDAVAQDGRSALRNAEQLERVGGRFDEALTAYQSVVTLVSAPLSVRGDAAMGAVRCMVAQGNVQAVEAFTQALPEGVAGALPEADLGVILAAATGQLPMQDDGAGSDERIRGFIDSLAKEENAQSFKNSLLELGPLAEPFLMAAVRTSTEPTVIDRTMGLLAKRVVADPESQAVSFFAGLDPKDEPILTMRALRSLGAVRAFGQRHTAALSGLIDRSRASRLPGLVDAVMPFLAARANELDRARLVELAAPSNSAHHDPLRWAVFHPDVSPRLRVEVGRVYLDSARAMVVSELLLPGPWDLWTAAATNARWDVRAVAFQIRPVEAEPEWTDVSRQAVADAFVQTVLESMTDDRESVLRDLVRVHNGPWQVTVDSNGNRVPAGDPNGALATLPLTPSHWKQLMDAGVMLPGRGRVRATGAQAEDEPIVMFAAQLAERESVRTMLSQEIGAVVESGENVNERLSPIFRGLKEGVDGAVVTRLVLPIYAQVPNFAVKPLGRSMLKHLAFQPGPEPFQFVKSQLEAHDLGDDGGDLVKAMMRSWNPERFLALLESDIDPRWTGLVLQRFDPKNPSIDLGGAWVDAVADVFETHPIEDVRDDALKILRRANGVDRVTISDVRLPETWDGGDTSRFAKDLALIAVQRGDLLEAYRTFVADAGAALHGPSGEIMMSAVCEAVSLRARNESVESETKQVLSGEVFRFVERKGGIHRRLDVARDAWRTTAVLRNGVMPDEAFRTVFEATDPAPSQSLLRAALDGLTDEQRVLFRTSIEALLQYPSSMVRTPAIQLTTQFMDRRAATALVELLRDPTQRQLVTESLAQIRRYLEERERWVLTDGATGGLTPLGALIQQSRDDDPEVRLLAIRSMGALGDASVLPHLIELTKSQVAAEANAAKQALSKLLDEQ